MPYYKFHEDDLFINTIKAEPQYNFYIWSGSVFVDSIPPLSGTKATNTDPNIYGVPNGYISLYEYNIDRLTDEKIYPFMYKDGKRNSFKSVSKVNYDTQYSPGDIVSSSYNMSSSIDIIFRPLTTGLSPGLDPFDWRKEIIALKNTMNHYAYMSKHYEYTSSLGDKYNQKIKLISIPSIFYGSSIEKGTVRLDYYYSGSLVASLEDNRKNGELIQTSGAISAHDGKVAGVVLYNEGFIILTGSWDLSDFAGQGLPYPKWVYSYPPGVSGFGSINNEEFKWYRWGYGHDIPINSMNIDVKTQMLSSSFSLSYSGSTETQVMTMLAQANYGELNYSNNPTSYSGSTINKISILSAQTGAYQYIEKPITINNVVSASYTDQNPPYKKTTYISKVAVYDEDKNLIGIAKLATPVEKTEDTNYTFKIKLDI